MWGKNDDDNLCFVPDYGGNNSNVSPLSLLMASDSLLS